MGEDAREKRKLPAAATRVAEEEQMDKFYQLLKSIREMRQGRQEARIARSAAWTPAFEWEDFAGNVPPGGRPASVPISLEDGEAKKKKKKVVEDNMIDLNLPL